MSATDKDTRGPIARFFLPDFCSAGAVLAVVLISEIVAIMFAIARQTLHQSFWIDLASCSLFLLWIGLGCAAVLCRARPWLHRMPAPRAAMITIALLVDRKSVV